MPEGHTIHRRARDHQRDFAGQTLLVSSPQGRFRDGARQLNRRTLERVEAWGKHLFYWWDGSLVLHVHLGLYGKFRQHRCPPPAPRGQVRLRVVGSDQAFDLNGPNACEVLAPERRDALIARLGPDPLRRDADPDMAWTRICRSRAAIGALLLNQEVIAGVGNVFRAEVLHMLGMHPERPGNSLQRGEFDRLWSLLSDMLRIGVRYNRIITADPHVVGKSRGRMARDERLLVYKKEFCTHCARRVSSWELGNRTIYACLRCQRSQ